MNPICVLTDSTVQFAKPSFSGRQHVTIVPLGSQINSQVYSPGSDQKNIVFPAILDENLVTQLTVPSVEEFRDLFLRISEEYREAIAIFHSDELSSTGPNAQEAARLVRGRINVQVINSQSISVGLGFLVQAAADMVAAGNSLTEIDRSMRKIIPHIYSVFCIPNLSYLFHAGFVGESQSAIGEMLNLLPLFTLEEGHLTPIEKVRNIRQLLDFMIEFLDEFNDLEQIALIQSTPSINHEIRALREHVTENFENTPFSEIPINLPMVTLFGPKCVGLFAIETPGE
ncbi:MAG TPA: DegV family protein [Anaerolineaceae bacterium]|nr:DegV family protein [Anaerolineaceae bacterium]